MTQPAAQLALSGIEPGRDASPTSTVPPRPTPTAELRGRCNECGQYPKARLGTGLLVRHNYHRSDSRDRRGRCTGTNTIPTSYHWLDLEKVK